jgi:predicted membrane protein DUF2231
MPSPLTTRVEIPILTGGSPKATTPKYSSHLSIERTPVRTPASIGKHPIHPMLIVFPIGLWIFSLACDLIRLAGAPGDAWATVAFFSMVGGFIGALCAAVPGFIDLLFYGVGVEGRE